MVTVEDVRLLVGTHSVAEEVALWVDVEGTRWVSVGKSLDRSFSSLSDVSAIIRMTPYLSMAS